MVARSQGAKLDIGPLELFPWNATPADPHADSMKIKTALHRLAGYD